MTFPRLGLVAALSAAVVCGVSILRSERLERPRDPEFNGRSIAGKAVDTAAATGELGSFPHRGQPDVSLFHPHHLTGFLISTVSRSPSSHPPEPGTGRRRRRLSTP